MGKMALLIILGLTITVGVVAYTINKSKKELGENVAGFDKYTTARNLGHTGVNMVLRAFDRDDPGLKDTIEHGRTYKMAVNALGGVCSLSVRIPDTTHKELVDLVSKARYMDSSFNMKIRLRRQPVPFPAIGEALGLRVPDVVFRITGTTSLIDGRNHDINGNLTSDTSNKPGVGVLAPKDTTDVLKYAANIEGTRDVVVDSNMLLPSAYVDEYINAANIKYIGDQTIAGTTEWGTATTPKIVYCEGDVHISGTVTGYGILVIHGDMYISGSIDFHGLVIAYQEAVIEVDEVGGGSKHSNIIGATLVAGAAGSSFEMKGTQSTVYSRDALEMAKWIARLQAYYVIWWYETDQPMANL